MLNEGFTYRKTRILSDFWSIRNIVLFLLIPVLLLPLPILIANPASRCAYVLLLMAVYWTLEVIPMAMTGLIPILLFPLFGILSVKDTAPAYAAPTIILWVCGLMVACAVEHWNLHKRIALNTILFVGAAPNRLLLGLMLPTWFLSMWISNTATTAMMTPIVLAILDQLKPDPGKSEVEVSGAESLFDSQIDQEPIRETPDLEIVEKHQYVNRRHREEYERLNKALTLCIAYAANVGGTASLIGTGPNIVLLEKTDEMYDELNTINPINFASWFMFGLPVSFLCLFVIWLWMQLQFLRCKDFTACSKSEYTGKVKALVKEELQKLGPFSFAEWATLINFIILALLWFFRNPQFMTGWGSFFNQGYIKDTCAAVLITSIMFVFPSRMPRILCCRKDNVRAEVISPLLTWDVVQHGVPWLIVWLLGGGFALAKGFKSSGLSLWIGEQLSGLSHLSPWVLLIVLTLIAALLTEFTSNIATAAIVLPIVRDMAVSLRIHPLYVMFPVTLATSFAFMLPVATLPNAIVYSTGRFKLIDMIKAGFCLNLLCLTVLNVGANTWGKAAFNLDHFPDAMVNLNRTELL